MRRPILLTALATGLFSVASAQLPTFKPGFNLFSKEQDIKLGREAAAEVEKKQPVIRDSRLDGYINDVGRRLAAAPLAQGWPFSFKVINDKSINAFALPGGPMFVNTGAIRGVDNEGQLAAIMAHEMSHVILRHGTHQVSKANMIQLPAALLGGAMGSRGGMLGTLGQLGVTLGANSMILSFSRDAERQADLLGTQIMAQAGYNPIEMARVFEKLQSQGSSRSLQFFSDHPNPGNRVQYIQDEIRYLPQRDYTAESNARFAEVQRVVGAVPAVATAAPAKAQLADPAAARPGTQLRQYRGNGFSFLYPDNWQVMGDQDASAVTIAAQQGIVPVRGGGSQVGFGLLASYYLPQSGAVGDLAQDTEALLRQLQQQNPTLQLGQRGEIVRLNGAEAMVTRFGSASPFQGERESDTVVTVARPEGLFYLVLIAPDDEMARAQTAFEKIINSLRFNG